MGKFIDLTGKKFGKLLVISQSSRAKNNSIRWLCKCDCGKEVIVQGGHLRSGHTTSCGCLQTKHNMTNTRLYGIWNGMINRCTNKNKSSYKYYGERGITFCPEWREFVNFYNWAIKNGYNEKLTLDRINPNKNYSPENCRWASLKEQANNLRTNRKLTFNNETLTIAQWSEKLNIPHATITRRIDVYNWTVEKTLSTPVKKHIYVNYNNKKILLSELSKKLNLTYQQAYDKFKRGK